MGWWWTRKTSCITGTVMGNGAMSFSGSSTAQPTGPELISRQRLKKRAAGQTCPCRNGDKKSILPASLPERVKRRWTIPESELGEDHRPTSTAAGALLGFTGDGSAAERNEMRNEMEFSGVD